MSARISHKAAVLASVAGIGLSAAAGHAFAQAAAAAGGPTTAPAEPSRSTVETQPKDVSSAQVVSDSPANPAPASSQNIIVTGTSIRGVSAVGSEAIRVSRDQLVAAGRSQPVDILREIPQIQNLGYDDAPHVAQNGNGNLQRGSTINLRGLGSNATLLLIDGHRIAPTGNVFSFTEANQLPVSAIERIDVVADGASAIYGSDAVAGVVNYITRKTFNGVEATARYTSSKRYDEYGAGLILGHSWASFGNAGPGHVVIAYDHNSRESMRAGSSPFLRQDLRPLGGPDNRIRTNNATSTAPGNIVVPAATNNTTLPSAGRFTYFGIPPGSSGVGLTGAQLLLNQPNLADQADYTDFLPSTRRDQLSVNFTQELTPDVTVYYGGFVNRRKSVLHSYPQSGIRTLPASSPFYIPGVPGVAPGAPETVLFAFYKDVGTGQAHITDTETSNTVGTRLQLPNGWLGDLSFTNSVDRNCANCIPALSNNIDAAVLQAELNAGRYNPFASTPADPAELIKFLPSAYDRSYSVLDDALLKFDGPLFRLPGGVVRAAVGAEYMYLVQARTSIGVRATSDTVGARAKRNIDSYYAEAFVPLVGPDNALPLVNRLVLDFAVRTENYSDFGRTTNPKVGFTWTVDGDLSFRGAWGKSFRAPNLIENNPVFFSRVGLATLNNAAGDPTIPVQNTATGTTNVVSVAGSNANLEPETATNWSLGLEYRPHYVPGLQLTATYYNINYTNQIVGLQTAGATFLASPGNRALYAPYIVAAPQPAGCINGVPSTYNPLYREALAQPSLTAPDQSNFCSAAAITYTRNVNAATDRQDGVDLSGSYNLTTGFGTWTFAGTFTRILHNDLSVVPGARSIEALDIMNFPVSRRGRASVNWSLGGWTASVAANYLGSYTNNLPITVNGVLRPVSKIPAWTTVDALISYAIREGGPFGRWGQGVRLSLNMRNLLDKDPPLVLSANGNAMDVQNANPFGRIVTFQVTKAF